MTPPVAGSELNLIPRDTAYDPPRNRSSLSPFMLRISDSIPSTAVLGAALPEHKVVRTPGVGAHMCSACWPVSSAPSPSLHLLPAVLRHESRPSHCTLSPWDAGAAFASFLPHVPFPTDESAPFTRRGVRIRLPALRTSLIVCPGFLLLRSTTKPVAKSLCPSKSPRTRIKSMNLFSKASWV